jgi:hypothetical protein
LYAAQSKKERLRLLSEKRRAVTVGKKKTLAGEAAAHAVRKRKMRKDEGANT